MQIHISFDTKPLTRALGSIAQKQIPFAIARTMTALARIAVTDIKTEMSSIFDRPTPFTLNAFYAKPAKRGDPTAYVAPREYAVKGRAAYKYLLPQILGGDRAMKGLEKALSGLSGGQYIVPARGARLDAYGNMSRGQIVQILSRLNVMMDPTANASERTIKRLRGQKLTVARSLNTSDYFVAREGGNGRAYGIYQLVSKGHVEPVLTFVPRAPTYQSIFPLGKIVERSVQRNARAEFAKAMAAAMSTAR